jgi:hypothetical protein
MSARRYVLVVALVTLFACAGVVALTATIDPYGLRFAAAETEVPPQGGEFLRKALLVGQVMPRTIILGTSRANSGLDTHHRAFSAHDAPVISLALGAAQIEHMRLLLIHANTVSRLRKAVIGLDIESFLGGGRSDFDPAALAGNPDSQPSWLTRLRADFSRPALSAAIARLVSHESTLPRTDFEARLKELQGQRGVVWITEINNFYARLADLFPPAAQASRWQADPRRRAAMQSFRGLLEYAQRHDIELNLFISPVHARYLDWYRRVGWWPLYEDWKRELVAAVAAARGSDGAKSRVFLWDFSGFHSAATERVPRLGDLDARMKWYSESSHYTHALGDLILQRMLADDAIESSFLPGGRIDRANIELHLVRAKIDGDRYRAAQPAEAANVREMAAYLAHIGRKKP